nr:ester cyclase [Modestobacter sp. DSM 44400]
MGIDTKAVVRRMVDECVNADRAELLDRYVPPGVRVHPGTPGTASDTVGLDELSAAFRGFHTTFPDLSHHAGEMVAEGDLVAARWTGDRHPLGRAGRHPRERDGGALGRHGPSPVHRREDRRVVAQRRLLVAAE